ncbi:unnamed protein product [Closterium sp. NIES-53]
MASYITHVVKGLQSGYNLMRRMLVMTCVSESLGKDTLTSHIINDEVIQEAERPIELLPPPNYVVLTKRGSWQGQRGDSGGGKSPKDADKTKSAGDGGRRRKFWVCGDPDHLSFEESDDDDKGSRRRSAGRRPRRESKPRKEKQLTTAAKDADSSSGGKGQGNGEVSCSLVGVMEPTVSLAPEAGGLRRPGAEQRREAIRKFNGALQTAKGSGTVTLQGDAGKQVLIPNVIYVPVVQANLLSVGQLKDSGVRLHDNGDEMLLVSVAGDVLGRAKYIGRVLCTDFCPCMTKPTAATMQAVALRTIASATKLTPDRWHARLAHVGVDTITSSAKHEVATGHQAINRGRLAVRLLRRREVGAARLPDKSSDTDEALAFVHINLCGPFRVATKDSSLHFLLPKDRKTRFVWVKSIAKKSYVLREFENWLLVVERQTKKSVLMLRPDR